MNISATRIALLTSLIVLAGLLGVRWGPAQDVASITVRVVKLEEGASSLRDQIRALESATRFQSYLSCVQLRRSDPAALPPDCTPIIQARGGQ